MPGHAAAPPAAGSQPPHLIAVAALLPNKDQLLLLAALARLTELPWTASLLGSDSADPAYAARLRETVERLGLRGRISVPGELRGAALEAEWAAADLSLLISRAETYGLVVTESLARGIPVVVREGTGAVEALAAGSGPHSGTGHRPRARERRGKHPAGHRRRARRRPGAAGRGAAALAHRPRAPGALAGRRPHRAGTAARLGPTARTVLEILGPGVPDDSSGRVDSAGQQAVGQ